MIGDLNRDIKAANSIMQSIRQIIRGLQNWIAELMEKRAELLEAKKEAKPLTLPQLLMEYMLLFSWNQNGGALTVGCGV